MLSIMLWSAPSALNHKDGILADVSHVQSIVHAHSQLHSVTLIQFVPSQSDAQARHSQQLTLSGRHLEDNGILADVPQSNFVAQFGFAGRYHPLSGRRERNPENGASVSLPSVEHLKPQTASNGERESLSNRFYSSQRGLCIL